MLLFNNITQNFYHSDGIDPITGKMYLTCITPGGTDRVRVIPRPKPGFNPLDHLKPRYTIIEG